MGIVFAFMAARYLNSEYNKIDRTVAQQEIKDLTVANFASTNISQWTNDAGYLATVDVSQIKNGSNLYFDYRPNNVQCANNQILRYDLFNARWVCGNDAASSGSASWGTITGSLSAQSDLQEALDSKLSINSSLGGDVSGPLANTAVANDSHEHTGSTISGLSVTDFTSPNISQWINDANYLTGVNFSQVTNGAGVFLDYRPDNTACTQGQVLKYDAGLSRWICGTDSGAGAVAWGDISGNIADQTDLNAALTAKLGTTASFGGDVTGTYDAIDVTNDGHEHTGATISGLAVADFTSPNISQWTNDSGYITNDTSVPKDNLTNTGTLPFTWGTSELASQVIVEGENISLLTNNAGYITGLNHSQVTNANGIYWDYRPNNAACSQDQVLKYDAGLNRWVCGTDTGASSVTWGAITGTLSDQIDLNIALQAKLATAASFGGDVAGTYNNLAVSNDSHDHTAATISGLTTADFTSPNISQWTNDSGFISGVNFAQVANGSNIYLNYKPNDTACSHDQTLKYDAGLSRWVCGNDNGAGTIAWGSINGTLGDQADLSAALSSKLALTASFGGDASGTYDNLAISNDSHNHTGATITGLGTSNFTSANISQWTNDSGYITGLDVSQVTNGSGKYFNYKPNDTACSNGQILEYDATNSRWICANDDTGTGGGGGPITLPTWLKSINTPKQTADPVDDEFNTSTLDSKWNVTSGAQEAINLLETGTVNRFDLTSEPGALLVQTKTTPFSMRQDVTIPDNSSIILSISGTPNGPINDGDNMRMSISLNDNDTAYINGNYLELALEQDTDTFNVQGFKTGGTYTTVGDTFNVAETLYLRIMRSGLTYSAFVSTDGTNWTYIYQVTTPNALDNVWIYVIGPTAYDYAPIVKFDWIRQANNSPSLWVSDLSISGGGDVTVGSMTGSTLFADTTADDEWLGLGTSAARIEFDDQATDEVQILDANVGIGQTQPQHKLDVNGNIGIVAAGYLNFGTSDGSSGYGIRDNNGDIEYKDDGGTWIALNALGSGGGNAIYDKWDPDAPPASPNANNDEFDDGSIDASWTQSGTGSATEENNGLRITDNNYLYKTLPAGDFTIWTKISTSGMPQFVNYSQAMLAVQNGTGTIWTVGHTGRSNNSALIEVINWSNYLWWSSTPVGIGISTENFYYFSIRRTGSTLSFWVSNDGVTYNMVYTVADPGVTRMGVINNGTSYMVVDYLRYLPTYKNQYWTPEGQLVPQGGGGGSVTVGSMTGSTVFSDSTADDNWIGLGSTSGRIEFDDQAVDELQILNASVGIGVTQPQHTLDVNGNIGIVASGYLNFGTTDGSSGYGIRDNNGKIEVKNNNGSWKEIDDQPSWAINPDKPPSSANSMDDEFNDTALDAKWTVWNQLPGQAITEQGNVLTMQSPSSIQSRVLAITQPAPGGTWKFRAKMYLESPTWNYFGFGLLTRRETGGDKTLQVGQLWHQSNNGDSLWAIYLNGTTYSSEADLYNIHANPMYLEVEYDGTNIIWRHSTSGVYYSKFYSAVATSAIGGAPETVGIYLHPWGDGNPNWGGIVSIDWFRRVQ